MTYAFYFVCKALGHAVAVASVAPGRVAATPDEMLRRVEPLRGLA